MNNQIPKAAFFDIDGTLIPYDTRCISQADCEAIEALRETGTLIFIVTGRHICDIDNIPFAVNGAVCCNGAMSYIVKACPEPFDMLKVNWSRRDGCARFSERDRFMLVEDHPIPRQQAIDIARIIDINQIPASVCTETRTMCANLTQKEYEFIRRVNMPSPKIGNILEAAEKERIYSFGPFVSPEEEKILFKDVLHGLDTFRWCGEYCDVNIHGLDKVSGIKRILDTFLIDPADIIAFGDGSNDISMLEYAGCGIAMETADDEVKSAADYITSSANDSGVSKWLLSESCAKRE